MKEGMNSEKAKKFLQEVGPGQHFKIHLGTNISNLFELKDALEIISDDSFNHHVTPTKNDFSGWIKEVIKDKELAFAVKDIKNREQMRDLIDSRLNELEEISLGTTYAEEVKATALNFLLGFVLGLIAGYIMGVF